MTRPTRARAASLLIALGGGLCLAQAGLIHAKARLGQALIEGAWQRTLGGEEGVRPWPWADTTPVARLQVPAHAVDVYVLAGGSGHALAWGPGHLAGSARPGAPGNAVLAGHRDTHFAFLGALRPGDQVYAEDSRGRVTRYSVRDHFVTHERDTRVLTPGGATRLTMITCWPFEDPIPGGPKRYVVVAEAIRASPCPGGPANAHQNARSSNRKAGCEQGSSKEPSDPPAPRV